MTYKKLRRCAKEQIPRLDLCHNAKRIAIVRSRARSQNSLKSIEQLLTCFQRVCNQADRVFLIPAMRQPAAEIPLFRFRFVTEHNNSQIVITVMCGRLNNQIFSKCNAFCPLSDHAARKMFTKRETNRAVIHFCKTLHKLCRLLSQKVTFQL